MRILIFLISFLFFLTPLSAGELSDYERVRCIIHLHTDISGGRKTLASYVREAKEKGIEAIVVTDEDWRRWEYGVPPFRRFFKKTIQEKSVMTFGVERYLSLIENLNEKYKEIVIIEGVQTNPFYYWSGNFFKGTMTLNNRNKDMLVIGLGDADDYINMPLVANYKSRFDAYHGDKFTRPYQDLIDYVTGRGGLIFWSHPEYSENTEQYGIKLLTVPYQWDLVGTYNYTGFGIFWEGHREAGKPRGLWDRILTEYCEGKRGSPIWAIGELEEEGIGDKNLDDVLNVVYVEGLSRREILEALKKGRFYVTYKEFDRVPLRLDEFKVCDETGIQAATMGEEISFSGVPIIKIRISHERPIDEDITAKLIRNNKVIEEITGKPPLEIEYRDEDLAEDQKYYYRLDAKSYGEIKLISNPIFFKKKY